MEERRDAPSVTAPLARLRAPLAEFLHLEAAGGVVLVVAPRWRWSGQLAVAGQLPDLWSTHLEISLGSHTLDLTLQEW
jgi:hypothetical protein